jgi:hypothetical protein
MSQPLNPLFDSHRKFLAFANAGRPYVVVELDNTSEPTAIAGYSDPAFAIRACNELNMVRHIFLAESGAKQSDPRKEAAGARARNAVEDLNGGHRREALGVGRLSRRRHSCTEGRPWVRNGSGVSQTS